MSVWIFTPQNPKREQKVAVLKVGAGWDFNIPVEYLPCLCPSASDTYVAVPQPPSSAPFGVARGKAALQHQDLLPKASL